ncbi:hypothetical protein ACVGX7_00015 [Enterobacter hormaechei]
MLDQNVVKQHCRIDTDFTGDDCLVVFYTCLLYTNDAADDQAPV